MRYGWSIRNISCTMIAENATKDVAIYESILLATNGKEERKLTHLHYSGWNDGKEVPDEDIFEVLIDRIEEIQSATPRPPVHAHCAFGKGRSATTMTTHYLRQEIREQLQNGTPLDEIKINIPETIYQFRKMRPDFLTRYSQVTNVYSLTSRFYSRLKLQYDEINRVTSLATNVNFINYL
jgi:protein tyrosine phosphatase